MTGIESKGWQESEASKMAASIDPGGGDGQRGHQSNPIDTLYRINEKPNDKRASGLELPMKTKRLRQILSSKE